MNAVIQKLEEVIRLESDIYNGIFIIEENKSEAIINRAGKAIEELSSSQEKLLGKIESLEKKRTDLMDQYRKFALLRHDGEEITLLDIIDSLDGNSSSALQKSGIELKKILRKLKSIQDINTKLLKDNMEFFDLLLSGLRNSSTLKSGYGSDGREQARVFNPVLFNIKA